MSKEGEGGLTPDAWRTQCITCEKKSIKPEYDIVQNNDAELTLCDFCKLEGFQKIKDKTPLFSVETLLDRIEDLETQTTLWNRRWMHLKLELKELKEASK